MDPPKLEFDLSWTKHIVPGHHVLWFNSEKVTLYSTILPPGDPPLSDYYNTRTFSHLIPGGFLCSIRSDLPASLLSQEQWKLAASLGWPNEYEGIIRILSLPAS
jgi:hypothetical protein